MWKPILTSLTFLLFMSGCASSPQTRALLSDSNFAPRSYEISGVPFIEQSENFCGPATLAMVAQYEHIDASLTELGTMMFTPGKRGTLQADFMGAARRLGLLAIEITSLKNILTEVAANHPVVVLENLGSTANPIWHYAVLHGYDLEQKELIFHSGPDQNFRLSLSQFERVWKGSEDWAMVALKAGELPVTTTLQQNLTAASSLERVQKIKEANLTYQSIESKWPDSVGALFGLGNTYAGLHDYKRSAQAFEAAAKLSPNTGAIWNNLGEVYLKLHQKTKAKNALKTAKKLTLQSKEPGP